MKSRPSAWRQKGKHMALSLQEQETLISWDRAGGMMNVYTADPYLMARLDKLPSIYKRVRIYREGGETIAADYKAEKRFCTLRRSDTRRAKES